MVFSQALASCLELDGATPDDGSLEPGGVTRGIRLGISVGRIVT